MLFIIGRRILMLVAAVLVAGAGTGIARSAFAADAPAGSVGAGRIVRPGTGIHGTFDAGRWRMQLDRSGAPSFVQYRRTSAVPPIPLPEDANWDDRFGPIGGPDGPVYAIAIDGDDVFIGGDFHHIGNVAAERVARWDGTRWRSLGTGGNNGVDRVVLALAVIGDRVYVGGQFQHAGILTTPNMAVWSRSQGTWSALGIGISGGEDALVACFAVSGGDLYVGGRFTAAGNLLANNIAKFDGTRFSRLGAGVFGDVFALAAQEGTLYVGGRFESAGNVPSTNLARWDVSSSTWSSFGGTDSAVYALTVDGNDLYIGGHFNRAGGTPVAAIVRWNQADRGWHPMANGLPYGNPTNVVNAIVVDGESVFVGGNFWMGSVKAYDRIDSVRSFVRYDKRTDSWSAVGDRLLVPASFSNPQVYALVKDGRELWIGGIITQSRPAPTDLFNKFDIDRQLWYDVGPSVDAQANTVVRSGQDLLFGGSFRFAGAHVIQKIGRWRDGRWSPIGDGFADGAVNAIVLNGSTIYAGGTMRRSGTTTVNSIAAWDGTAWHTLDKGLSNLDTSVAADVRALAVVGSDLYVAGTFLLAGEQTVNGIARWDGSAWHALGQGLMLKNGSGDAVPGEIRSLVVDGDLLYVGGLFNDAGGISVSNLAVWNMKTSTWSPVAGGTNGLVTALALRDGHLYVGGTFTLAGAIGTAGIGDLDLGTGTWRPLATSLGGEIDALGFGGNDLYAAGSFSSIESLSAVGNIARWDGESWRSLGSGTNGAVTSLIADTEGVFLTGAFTEAGVLLSNYIGHWSTSAWAAVHALPQEAVAGASLAGVTPNPIGAGASFTILLPTAADVSLELFAPDGRRAASITEGWYDAGIHSMAWQRGDLPDGIYLCRLRRGDHVETRTVILQR